MKIWIILRIVFGNRRFIAIYYAKFNGGIIFLQRGGQVKCDGLWFDVIRYSLGTFTNGICLVLK